MISKTDINNILSKYDTNDIKICTVCSHSALQIFHGARQEGFRTIGVLTKDREDTYRSFPIACPDELLYVNRFEDMLNQDFQGELRKRNSVVIPTGSFVEYIGPENLENKFYVPMFGNRKTLEWERDRQKQRQWLEGAGLKLPKQYKDPSEIDNKVFVKLSGAKGGRGFFIVDSEKELYEELGERIRKGSISKEDSENITIQEFISGVRYYPHYFYSIFENGGARVGDGRVELLSMDKRIEPIDECYRGLPDVPEEFFDYTVTGNQPIVIRESLLPPIIDIGINTVKTSIDLFPPGMLGAFCLETIYHPDRGFTVFEISARIVAGTNLFPQGSPYSCYIFDEPMSTGRRIAREIKKGIELDQLKKIIY